MNVSYWELKTWLKNVDFTIVGSGIVGLSTALHLKKKMPNSKIVILEKGLFPHGASTKNAGFACFGSLGELLDDLQNTTIDEIVGLIRYRKKGLEALIGLLGKEYVDYSSKRR